MTQPDPLRQPVFYVVEMTVPFASLEEVKARAPQTLAERLTAGDPFVRDGTVVTHRIRPWANMFAH
jgi:hypothetical protein